MNGEFGQLYNELDKRLSLGEQETRLWRKNHDHSAEERTKSTNRKLDELAVRIHTAPCKNHAAWIGDLKRRAAFIETTILGSVFVAVVTKLVGLW